MKRADIDEICDSKGPQDCNKCPDYDTCDYCGRRVCKYVSIIVSDTENPQDEELWCRYCCKNAGFSSSEMEKGKVFIT